MQYQWMSNLLQSIRKEERREHPEKESEGNQGNTPPPPSQGELPHVDMISRQRSPKRKERKRSIVHGGRSFFFSPSVPANGKAHLGARGELEGTSPAFAGTPASGLLP